MTSRTYMGIDDRRDHGFRIPRPDLTAEIGSPNACSGCHANRDAAWAASQIETWLGPNRALRPHIGSAIAAGRQGPANAELAEASMNQRFPAIGRATALTLLVPPYSDAVAGAIASAVADPDPLMRDGALRALELAPAETRLRLGTAALADPVLSVRLSAVRVVADLRDLLSANEAGAFNRAADEYRAAHTMLAFAPEALAALAEFELSLGDANRAVAYFRDALTLDPRNALLRHSLGLALVRTGDRDAALQELRKSYEIDPTNPRYAYVYGVAMNSLGLNDDALTLLQDARRQFPTDFDIGWAVATMLRDAGDLEHARIVAAELAAQFPDNANAASLLDSMSPN